jgi:hypothetical protein
MKYKSINKELDRLFKKSINKIMIKENVSEIRMYEVRNNWGYYNWGFGRNDFRKGKWDIEEIELFNRLYIEKNSCWLVSDFSDRFEIWCKRSGMLEKRDRGWKDGSKEIWLVNKSKLRLVK